MVETVPVWVCKPMLGCFAMGCRAEGIDTSYEWANLVCYMLISINMHSSTRPIYQKA
jgi:hypothetical protein